MGERDVVRLVEEWQTGFYLIIGSALTGVVLAYALSSVQPPYGGLVGFSSGVIIAFLLFSYYLYIKFNK